jgi:hypothetical protein
MAGNAAAEGARRVFPDAECIVRPLADGGEGTVEALVSGLGGELLEVKVTGPALRPVKAVYGKVGETAVMEMAQAAGITLVSGVERDPLRTTTFGVGEMIRDAIAHGCRRFIVGIGGVTSYTIRISATQSYVPDEKKGRFNGAFNMLSTAGALIGEFLAGALTLVMSGRAVLLCVMLLCAVAAVVFIGGGKEHVSYIYNRSP